MTYEEAHTFLEVKQREMTRNRNLYNEKAININGLAILALEKQIPKKPIFEADGYDDSGELNYDTWICSCCGEHYEVDYDKYDFCPNCGQAIDWSDER